MHGGQRGFHSPAACLAVERRFEFAPRILPRTAAALPLERPGAHGRTNKIPGATMALRGGARGACSGSVQNVKSAAGTEAAVVVGREPAARRRRGQQAEDDGS